MLNSKEANIDLWKEALKKSGFGLATVAGDCMSPVLNVGDKVYIKHSAPSCYRTGDIVVFPLADSLMMHRIVGSLWTPRGKFFIHRGDKTSAMAFGLVKQGQILGRIILAKKDSKIVLASFFPKPRTIGLLSPFYSLLAMERCVVIWIKKFLSQG
jgi:hypothetical protein